MANKGLMNKRIPTLLGVIILIGGLIAGVAVVNMRTGVESKAGPTSSPKNVKISNLASTTFSVSWTTDIPLTGLIKYSEDPAKIIIPAGDVRDQISGTSQSYNNHTVNVSGLTANKTYYFLIVSGSGNYDDNGKPFQVRTTAQAVAPPEDIIFGKVVRENGDAVNGGIVFVEVEGGQTLSTITKSDGTWRLNLANSRDSSGKISTYDSSKTLLSIFVQAGANGTATALTDTKKDNPVPDIVLGKNQSFIEGGQVTPIESTQSAKVDSSQGFQIELSQVALSEQLEATSSVRILNPATNGEIISTDQPEFRGKAPAGTSVKLTVQSVEQVQVIQADASGNWTWTPPQKLEQGIHTLTVEYTDSNNQIVRIVRTFSVLVSSQPAFTATPSATPILIPSESLPPAEEVTPTLTPTPTEETSMPATSSAELEDAGALSVTLALVISGVLLLLFGNFSKKWIKTD